MAKVTVIRAQAAALEGEARQAVENPMPLQRDRLWFAGHAPRHILVWRSEGSIWNCRKFD
jgi:hypothetical protein